MPLFSLYSDIVKKKTLLKIKFKQVLIKKERKKESESIIGT